MSSAQQLIEKILKVCNLVEKLIPVCRVGIDRGDLLEKDEMNLIGLLSLVEALLDVAPFLHDQTVQEVYVWCDRVQFSRKVPELGAVDFIAHAPSPSHFHYEVPMVRELEVFFLKKFELIFKDITGYEILTWPIILRLEPKRGFHVSLPQASFIRDDEYVSEYTRDAEKYRALAETLKNLLLKYIPQDFLNLIDLYSVQVKKRLVEHLREFSKYSRRHE